ncbi:hypothetical protein FH972_022407 [Carpinus fangiana]|uniref:NADP-dependent oxidoreductase domain-containing protein n=1 Tax=Carpinus fangiana TaxID=176857 RepID=A0A5N6KSJ2_9ROSI|nr:hypothetical protein FH972_022407 [Carpinus fangiana]
MAHIHTPIPSLKLNDGASVPMLAYGTGTAWFKSGEGSEIDKTLIDSIKTAIKLEYYHLDGAEVYKTEPELGSAIKESGIARDKLFVTTKVMFGVSDIAKAIKTSLEKLQLDYVDLYLIHAPFFFKSDEEMQKAWAAMEQVKVDGLAKTIGVSNYLPKHLETTLKTAKIPPAVNQIEFHPYLQHKDLLDFHKKHNIATFAYGPLTALTKAAPGPVDDYIAALSTKYAVNPAEIFLRWCIDQDVVPVTTSGKEQRLSDYLRCATFKLTPKEIQEINDLGDQKHYRAFFKDKFAADDRS